MLHITRYYASAESARRAFERLKVEGFTDDLLEAGVPGSRSGTPHWFVSIRPPFGMGRTAMEILDRFAPIAADDRHERERSAGLDAISRLSRSPAPGAISRLSRSCSPGAISRLSRSRPSGAVASLSRSRSSDTIAALSRSKRSAAVSRLSASPATHAISRLSSGWFLSSMLGLPLLTRAQAPLESDSTLLLTDRASQRSPTAGR